MPVLLSTQNNNVYYAVTSSVPLRPPVPPTPIEEVMITRSDQICCLTSRGLKRGPEELLSCAHAAANKTNGLFVTLYPPHPNISSMSSDNDAKKVKLDQPSNALLKIAAAAANPIATGNGSTATAFICSTPASVTIPASAPATTTTIITERSRVVHLRNLPADFTDVELIRLCIPFGKIHNFLLLKSKGQAFVEYEDEQSAALLVSIWQTCPVTLRGKLIFCQFSNHHELKTDNKNAFNVASAVAVLPGGADPSVTLVSQTQQQPNSVLRVIIENMLYPVTLDILYQIFSRFGKVLRIITFTKNSTFQALVQFSEAVASQLAKTALDGQNVYSGCCTLRIDYSKLSTLNVKYNNEKSRDYTNPNLPSGELLDSSFGLNIAQMLGNSTASALSAFPSSLTFPIGGATAFTAPAFSQAAALQAAAAATAAGGLTFPAFSLAAATNNATLNSVAGLRTFPAAQFSSLSLSPVVLVSNLNEQKVTPDALFTLFGVYGDVQRVKILFNKKDNALIQYAEPAQSQLAIQHLDKVKLWGKVIRVAASKHMTVQMPKEGQPQEAGLTKDYSQSPLHRFKKPGSKNYMNIYPPSATLHLSNIPTGITEEFLLNAFAQEGFTVKAFKFFPKDHKMALMQMESVDDALPALIVMHNFKLADNAHLRVSFSKSGV